MKAKLLYRIQQGVAKIANVPKEAVWTYFVTFALRTLWSGGTSCRPSMIQDQTTIAGFRSCQALSKSICGNLPSSGK